MKSKLLAVCLFFYSIASSDASTVITATDHQSSEIYTVTRVTNMHGDNGKRTNKLYFWVKLMNAPPSCELVEITGGNISYKTTILIWQEVKKWSLDSSDFNHQSDGSFFFESNYLDSRTLLDVKVTARIRCRAPTPETRATLHFSLSNQYYGIDKDVSPPVMIDNFNPTVSIDVFDEQNFGTIFDTKPTEWKSLWRGNTPEHAKVTVDGHRVLAEGSVADRFKINDDIGDLEFKINGWVRFIPNGKPGILRRYLHIKIEYE
ncbi:hypothetical protein AAGR22_05345 [Erwinia sp. HDF1-3R]|uniref:hypothetical protein n=1 Tax=Erwinia sp. HDF1-3R TaxID=3141543 RepID=UPI0031F5BE97